MSAFDPKPFQPIPMDSTPEPLPDPTPSVFSLPDSIPPSGPVIDVPPIQVFPHPVEPEPVEGPDEGGEEFPRVPGEQDFLRPRDPEEFQEPFTEGGEPQAEETIVAQADAGNATDAGSDAPDADSAGGADAGGGDAGDGGDAGGGDAGGGDAGGGDGE